MRKSSTTMEEELHDVKRVHSYGQEEDLRDALGRMIRKVDELNTLLSQAYKTQTDLETSLKLARSNLQLALANNEMLEDALRRDTMNRGRDVGWRRSCDQASTSAVQVQGNGNGKMEEKARTRPPTPTDIPTSPTSPPTSSLPFQAQAQAQSQPQPPAQAPPVSTSSSSTAPPATESRFFRFRFGSGTLSTPSSRPQTPSQSQSPGMTKIPEAEPGEVPPSATSSSSVTNGPTANGTAANHLTSSSLPTLPTFDTTRLLELETLLETERARLKTALDDKKTLEAEIEGLSQALFEEANKMVKEERIRRAETEEELKMIREEKDALRGALGVVERENTRLREVCLPVMEGKEGTALVPSVDEENGKEGNGPEAEPREYDLPRSRSSSLDVLGVGDEEGGEDADPSPGSDAGRPSQDSTKVEEGNGGVEEELVEQEGDPTSSDTAVLMGEKVPW